MRRKAGKAYVEGVPTLGWGRGKECTFARALEAALAATDCPTSYPDIMGFSGLAFRVRWYHADKGQRWCPSSPVGEFPEEIEAVEKATGWKLRVEVLLGEENPRMERFAPEIVASIDAGRPVLAYEPRLNMDVVYGYEDGGSTLLLRDYFRGEEPLRIPASKLGPMLIYLESRVEPPPRLTSFKEALRVAVRNWRRGSVPRGGGKYFYGGAAYDDWIRDLGLVEGLTEKELKQLFTVNIWNFDSLEDARHAASTFLGQNGAFPEGEGREALRRAASMYREEEAALNTVFATRDAFLGGWSGKTIREWSPDVRLREQAVLAEARRVEAAAVEEMERALGAVGG